MNYRTFNNGQIVSRTVGPRRNFNPRNPNRFRQLPNRNGLVMNRNLRNQPLPLRRRTRRRNQRINARNNIQRNLNAPYFQNSNIVSKFKIQSRDQESMRLKITFPVPNSCFIDTTYVITIHPFFLNQILLNHSLNFTQYSIHQVTFTTQPLVPYTDTTALAVGYTTHCTPITYLDTDHWSKITNLNGKRGMAHTPFSYTIPVSDNTFHPLIPVVPSDIPFTLFVTSQTANTDLTAKILPYLTLTLTLKTQYTGDEINNTLSVNTNTFTTAAGGIQSNGVMAQSVGFVISSTAPNIDIGELVMMPGYAVANQNYTFPVSHNGSFIDPADIANDRGVIRLNYRELL